MEKNESAVTEDFAENNEFIENTKNKDKRKNKKPQNNWAILLTSDLNKTIRNNFVYKVREHQETMNENLNNVKFSMEDADRMLEVIHNSEKEFVKREKMNANVGKKPS